MVGTNDNLLETSLERFSELKVVSICDTQSLVDQHDFEQVYSDGSCFNNGQSNARAGIGVYFGPNNSFNLAKRVNGHQSNNRAELLAVCQAISIAIQLKIEKLCVNTDSSYVIKSIIEWRHKWSQDNLKNVRGQPVVNVNEFHAFERLIALAKNMQRCYRYVPAHASITANVEADILARLGAEKPLED